MLGYDTSLSKQQKRFALQSNAKLLNSSNLDTNKKALPFLG
jgi:hypothetical protein